MCALKQLFSVKAFSNWEQWNVIPKCVLLIWSFKWFLNEDLYLHLSHFSIPSCAGKDLDCPARNPYHSPQTLQSFSAINLNVHKPFIWNLYFNVVLHLIFSGILMPYMPCHYAVSYWFHVQKQIETNHRQAVISLTAGTKKSRKKRSAQLCDNLIFLLLELFCVQEPHVKILLRELYIVCTYVIYKIYINC